MKVAHFQFDEILKQVNDSSDPETTLRSIINEPYVHFYLYELVNENWPDFDVDTIEFKRSEYHRSMAGALLLNKHSANVFKTVIMADGVSKHTKMFHTKTLLEMLDCEESKILEAILKKNLTALYPNITHELINKVL